MSPSVTRFGERFGQLDADRPACRDRREDRISVVASAYERSSLSAGDLGDLRPGRELSS
jgi:hypothetical protein